MSNFRKKRISLMPFIAVFIAVGIIMVSCKKEENNSNSNCENGGNPPASIVDGALPGTFSIGANRQVRFSQGNLQYTTTGTHAVADGGTAPGTWRFAEHQWDTIGAANNNISSTYTGWIDLFGWGTSGYNSKYPYMTSTTNSHYAESNDIANTNYDWGVYNAIINGGNQPGLWRTLTHDEWGYLIDGRATASGIRYAKATVNGVPGLIIVPDNWDTSTYALSCTAAYTSNVITFAQWATLENAGCAFLPAAGVRDGSTVYQVAVFGYYWFATCMRLSHSTDPYYLYFRSDNMSMYYGFHDHYGYSVRLVTDVQ